MSAFRRRRAFRTVAWLALLCPAGAFAADAGTPSAYAVRAARAEPVFAIRAELASVAAAPQAVFTATATLQPAGVATRCDDAVFGDGFEAPEGGADVARY